MIDIANLATNGLFAFGGVWVLTYFTEKYTSLKLDTQTKLILMGLIAFAVGFVPAELANDFANRIKEAVAVAVGFTGFYQGTKNVAKAVGGNK